jgi:hypothetical protein
MKFQTFTPEPGLANRIYKTFTRMVRPTLSTTLRIIQNRHPEPHPLLLPPPPNTIMKRFSTNK